MSNLIQKNASYLCEGDWIRLMDLWNGLNAYGEPIYRIYEVSSIEPMTVHGLEYVKVYMTCMEGPMTGREASPRFRSIRPIDVQIGF